MNRVASILSPGRVRQDHSASTKIQLFELAGSLFAGDGGLDAAQVAASLQAREDRGSTGLGHGVALPHARVKDLRQALAAFVQLFPAISFDAPDGKPVSDALVLLVPEQAAEEHLQMLAEAAQMFNDRQFRERLRSQRDAAGVYRTFVGWPAPAA